MPLEDSEGSWCAGPQQGVNDRGGVLYTSKAARKDSKTS